MLPPYIMIYALVVNHLDSVKASVLRYRIASLSVSESCIAVDQFANSFLQVAH